MLLPQSNAILTQIAGGGLSEDDGGATPAGADTAKWTGTASAYVHEEVLAVAGPAGLNEARQTYIVIPGNFAPDVTILPEDTITFTYDGTSRTRIVRQIERHTLPGHLKTVRCHFRDT
jgi:hypothetical protein